MTNAEPNVTEAYAFACLNCGYGWEQSYEIAHHVDPNGRPFVTYLVDGAKVPSPLTRPGCQNCDGHLVRIMRAGQVSGTTARSAPGDRRGERPAATARHRSVLGFLHRRQDPAAGTA